MDEQEFKELLKELDKLPEYLEEKERQHYAHQKFLEDTMGDLYREIFEGNYAKYLTSAD